MQPRYPSMAYIPDRFLVVALSAVFAWKFGWDKKGVQILGTVKSTSGSAFPFRWPFQTDHMTHIREAMGTSFLIALLGFFESSVAAKSLGGGEGKTNGLQGMQLSANRELIALGTANLIGSCFMALPAFGGYGRSKVNASTGGTTPMSSIFLSLITVLCVLFLLPYFYYIPVGLGFNRSLQANVAIESSPMFDGHCSRLVTHRRSTSRHRIFCAHQRFNRAGSHACHFRGDHFLLAQPRHCYRCRPFPSPSDKAFNSATHSNPGSHTRHEQIRERRGQSQQARIH